MTLTSRRSTIPSVTYCTSPVPARETTFWSPAETHRPSYWTIYECRVIQHRGALLQESTDVILSPAEGAHLAYKGTMKRRVGRG
jgi:hypothetical protein